LIAEFEVAARGPLAERAQRVFSKYSLVRLKDHSSAPTCGHDRRERRRGQGGSTTNTGGSISFEDGNSFALLEPAFDPFIMSITGFRAGDTIALAHQSSGFFGSTYKYNWDQPTHQLTIFETPNLLPDAFEIARLTLSGTYGPSDFHADR